MAGVGMTRRVLISLGAVIVILVVGGTALWACGADAKELDQAATERTVGEAIDDAVGPEVSATTCTGEFEQAKGNELDCKVTLAGEAGVVRATVTQTDNEGSLDVVPLDAVLADADVAAQAKRSLADRFERSFQVDCGKDPATVRTPGDTFTCTARDRTSRRTIEVTVQDAYGTLQFTIPPSDED